MRVLIAEDDFASRKYMAKFLSRFGDTDITVDGEEAVAAFQMAVEDEQYYDLVCLDIMMPIMDGVEALYQIREIERQFQVPEKMAAKIIMTTALNEVDYVQGAFDIGCQGYATKPIDTEKFVMVMKKMGLITDEMIFQESRDI